MRSRRRLLCLALEAWLSLLVVALYLEQIWPSCCRHLGGIEGAWLRIAPDALLVLAQVLLLVLAVVIAEFLGRPPPPPAAVSVELALTRELLHSQTVPTLVETVEGAGSSPPLPPAEGAQIEVEEPSPHAAARGGGVAVDVAVVATVSAEIDRDPRNGMLSGGVAAGVMGALLMSAALEPCAFSLPPLVAALGIAFGCFPSCFMQRGLGLWLGIGTCWATIWLTIQTFAGASARGAGKLANGNANRRSER